MAGGLWYGVWGAGEALSEGDPEKAPRSHSSGEGRRDQRLLMPTSAGALLPYNLCQHTRVHNTCVHRCTHRCTQGPVTTSQATGKKETGPCEAGEAEPGFPLCFLTPTPTGQGSKAKTKHPSPFVQ